MTDRGLFAHETVAFGQENELVARDRVLFDGGADDAFAFAVRIYVGCVPGVEAAIVGGFEEGERLGC